MGHPVAAASSLPRFNSGDGGTNERTCLYCMVLYWIIMSPSVGKGQYALLLSVRPSAAYIANNSRTRRPSVPKLGMKVPHL